jgi:hypothetical protein
MAAKYNFSLDTTSNWQNLNSDILSRYQVVVFLDATILPAGKNVAV